MKQANTKLIGAFVFTGGLLAFIAIILFSNPDFFVKKSFFVAYYKQSVRGLNTGAPVLFRGVKVGEVKEIDGIFDAEEGTVRPRLILEIHPEVIKNIKVGDGDDLAFEALVEHGMRASLNSQSMLTGQLFVSLNFHPDKPVRFLGNKDDPYPEMPTIDSGFDKIMSKLEDLPLEEVFNQLNSTLKSAQTLLENPGMKSALDQLPDLVSDIDSLVEGSLTSAIKQLQATFATAQTSLDTLTNQLSTVSLPQFRATLIEMQTTIAALKSRLDPSDPLNLEILGMLRQLSETAQSIEILADYLEQHPEALLKGK